MSNKALVILSLVIGFLAYRFRREIQSLGENLAWGKISTEDTVKGLGCADLERVPTGALEPHKILGITPRQYVVLVEKCTGESPFTDFKISDIYKAMSDEVASNLLYIQGLPGTDPLKIKLNNQFHAGKSSEFLKKAYIIEAVQMAWDKSNKDKTVGRVVEKILTDQYGIIYNYNSFIINR